MDSAPYSSKSSQAPRKKICSQSDASSVICNRRCFRYIAVVSPAPPVVLTIAGFDPSSGAGVTADVKTIAAHGCYGVACISALTVQSTAGVKRVEPVNPELIAETLRELTSDIEVAAVHIGMLGSGKVAKTVADFLTKPKNGLPN